MRDVTVSREVDASADSVWAVLIDTRRWPEWGPSVASATVAGGGWNISAGASGTVRTVLGVQLPFRITEWEEGRRWRWDVARIPATGHMVRELSAERSEVTFEVPWFAAPYLAICRIALGRIAEAVGAADS